MPAPDPTRAQSPPPATDGPDHPTAPDGVAASSSGRPGRADRYQLGDEIDRGGMGTVYASRDTVLNRPVAVKILHDRYPAGSPSARRFADEAHITGQLQHPGIPPVHDLGTLSDGRPFLAMKLIKGRTLAEILASRERERPENAPNLLAVFEGICQAVGYAHAHGVIHRDLKPANVMVGAFGEVQVMDWGLAKVLASGGVEPRRPGDDPDRTTPDTEIHAPSDADSATRAGSILGTPAYMPPEQAIGAVDQIDRRSDVFGLGAVLCAMLTGQPPFVGDTAESTRQLAAKGKVADAFARLAGCGAEPDLIALCKRCLSPEKADRPADAGEVAAAVAGLRAAAEDRAKRAEVDRATAVVRAAEERKRRRVQLALAASVCGLLLASGGAGAWWWQARSATVADVEAALAEAAGHRDAGRWAAVRAALERADGRLAGGGPAGLRARVRQARADADMVAELDAIRLRQASVKDGYFDIGSAARLYSDAFRRYGLDLSEIPEADAIAAVRASSIRPVVGAGLDNWTRVLSNTDPLQARLRAIADGSDDDAWRKSFRAAVVANDVQRLKELAVQPEALAQPPIVLGWLGEELNDAELTGDAVRLLQQAQQRHPADFWLNHHLGKMLRRDIEPARPGLAVGYFRAAVAVRPDSPGALLNLGNAIEYTCD